MASAMGMEHGGLPRGTATIQGLPQPSEACLACHLIDTCLLWAALRAPVSSSTRTARARGTPVAVVVDCVGWMSAVCAWVGAELGTVAPLNGQAEAADIMPPWMTERLP